MFGKFFNGAIVTKLEQNFRSSGAIVAAARSLIVKNVNRTPKTIRTLSPTGSTLSVCECRNEQCEASAVANFITYLQKQNIPLREIAVLYRLQHVGLELRDMLQARGIPCSSRGNISVYGDFLAMSRFQRPMNTMFALLNDVLAALHIVLSESDDLSCKQVMEALCPSLCSSSVFKFAKRLQHEGVPLYKALLSARSHLLGLKKHDGLASCGFEMPLKADEEVVEGLHLLSQILEKAAADLRNTGMKNVIMNLLQQFSPFRTRKNIIKNVDGISMCESVSQHFKDSNLEFAGIKALLREASKFDEDWEKGELHRGICSEMEKSNGYKTLLQQKASRHTLRESYKLESKPCSGKTNSGQLKRLQCFIDHVTLKLHDGELGDCGDNYTPLKTNAKDMSEPEPRDEVVLSTLHQAKGLEWTAVILVRANEGIIPLMDAESSLQKITPQGLDSGFHVNPDKLETASGESNNGTHFQNTVCTLNNCSSDGAVMVVQDISALNVVDARRSSLCESVEEERRLMYVALTRAKRFFMVTYVMLQGQQIMSPSRFLGEIPKGLMRRNTCYDSKGSLNKEMIRPDPRKESDLNKPFVAIEETLSSCKLPFSSAEKGRASVNAARKKRTKKAELNSRKIVSKEVDDVAQSLKDIDEILDGMGVYSTCETSVEEIKVQTSKDLKRPRRRTYQVVNSSDDSDFEIPNKLLCKKSM